MRPSDSEARERAARELEKSFVVTAGAGTGKTSLIIERILHHLLERGTPLERIAAITFTVKAAAELRERLEDSLERCLELAAGSTSPQGMSEEADRVFLGGPQDHLDVAAVGLRGEQAHLGPGAADIGDDVRILREDLFEFSGDAFGLLQRRAGGRPVVQHEGAFVHQRHQAGL